MVKQAYCSACMRTQAVDVHWVALWIDSDGDLRITRPEKGCELDYERPDTVFACGQGSALALTERYLHWGDFRLAHDAHLALLADASTAELSHTL